MRNLIEQFYRAEDEISQEESWQETRNKTVSIVMPLETAVMLKTIANRFGTTLSPFCASILEQACIDSFSALTKKDQKKLADLADLDILLQLENQGVTFPKIEGQPKFRHWTRGVIGGDSE